MLHTTGKYGTQLLLTNSSLTAGLSVLNKDVCNFLFHVSLIIN